MDISKTLKCATFGLIIGASITGSQYLNNNKNNMYSESYHQLVNYDDKLLNSATATVKAESNVNEKVNVQDCVYLSDIDYMPESYTVYNSILKDKNLSGGLISLLVDGQKKMFLKGIFAHANAAVAYDLTGYDYDYLTAYLGVDTAVGSNGNGVRFEVHTSEDGINWTLKEKVNNNAVFKGDSNAYFLKYPIKGVKYFKIVVQDHGGNNTSDHSVFANAKLIKEGYEETVFDTVDYIKTVDEYDATIKSFNTINLNKEQEFTLLQRTFVKNVGYDLLQTMATGSSEYNETISWLFNNYDNLRLYVLGGKPDGGSYSASLIQLSRLYHKYHNDFNDTTPTNNKWYPSLTKGEVYKKMAVSLSLTHSTAVGYWAQINHPSNRSDALNRYAIFKDLYDRGKFVVSSRQDHTPWFEALHVEEMRYIMNSIVDDEEILWFNEYTQTRIDAHPNQEEKYLQPHTYIAYVWPNFQNPIFHDPANYEYFDNLFDGIFSKYGVTYSSEGDMVYKAWMSMRNKWGTGAVCGGISKLGTHIRAAHGTPASVISQPGHAAIIYYRKNADGKGYWTIDNDVSGWAQSGKTERLGIRMPLGWGNDSYVNGWAATYIILAQEALNDVENYEKSEELIMLADVFNDDAKKKEEILREALKVQNINIDAWWGLIQLYNNDNTKTEEDYYNLAAEMGDALLPFPLPLYNLLNQIKGKFTSTEYQFKFTVLQGKILNEEKSYNATDRVLQPSITRTVGAYLLGQTDTSLASFSFDGDNSGKIVLADRFNGNGIRWDYSIDGKQTWKEVSFSADEPHELQLTPEEIASITSENDIYVHIVGVNYNEENLYKIDILPSAGLPKNLYANDLENRMIATIPTIMWKYSDSDNWTYYRDQIPDLSGDVSITLKAGATGLYVGSNEEITYTFTANTDNDERKYISIDHLSIHSVSSEATGQGRHAKNVIDGNGNTSWHSDWNGNDKVKEIVIELDEPRNLTSFEYVPAAGGNGKIESAQILISVDGENWTEVVSGTNWTYKNANDVSMKTVDFPATKGKYIKIVGKKTQSASASKSFITGTMFNFYENTTVQVRGSFAFDGANAGKIILDKEYYNGLPWKYSLDSGNTWKDANGTEYQLDSTEMECINETDAIKLAFTGETKQFTLPIKKSSVPNIAPYVNDLENRLIALNNVQTLEWKIKDTNNAWKSYSDEEPVVLGNNTLLVRTKASGITQASDYIEYEFTEDHQDDSRKYISIKHMSLHGYSTQSVDGGRPYYAPNAIDGNPNTLWHTDFRYDVRQQDVKPFISVKLDSPRYISGIDFLQKKYKVNDPDYIKNMIVYVSEDGVNWTEAGRMDNCEKNLDMKSITFDSSVYGQYVKVEMDTYDIFASLAMLNLYEDVTKKLPTVTVEYSTTSATNQPVIATLVSDKDITVTNNDGSKEYTFTENGSFTFEFVDNDGNTGSVVAVVDYIDTKAPVGTIEYSLMDVTNQDVIATLSTNEKVTITNNNGSNTYTFTENGEFTFEFVDEAGNKGTATAYVTWISKTAPVGTITYDIKTPTNKSVVATLTADRKITILNNNGSNTYTFTENGSFTFEYVGEAGNRGTATATVTWINKETPTVDVTYSTKESTTDPVTVTLVNPSTKITIINNNGSATYTFNKNGTFTFEFVDEAGNKGSKTVTVDWIQEKVENKITLVYDKQTLTNQDVTVTLVSERPITIINNGGSNVYTFTENGEFIFEYIDEYGNAGVYKAEVSWIDKTELKVDVNYNITSPTAGNVIATISANRDITITNNNGSNTYTFTENGTFTFEYVDIFGQTGTITASVDWINKNVPQADVTYSTKDLTNQDVVVTLVNPDNKLTITNNNGSATYTFTENGSFVFEYMDELGNKGSTYVNVDWIDKTAPTADVKYSTTNKTNKDVVVTITPNKEVTILNNNGSNTYTFTQNGTFTFEYVDKAGNKGTTEVTVDWIYKKKPLLLVEYDKQDPTYKAVIATLVLRDGITVTNNNGNNVYVFTENGSFTFEYVDEYGNVGTTTAEVDWIKEETRVGLEYSTVEETNDPVTVTIKANNKIVVLNNDGNTSYTFTENGEFTFNYQDEFGDIYYITAKVDWIKDKVIDEPVQPIPPVTPVEPDKPVIPDIEIPVLKPDYNTNVVKPSRPSTGNTSSSSNSSSTVTKPTVTTTSPTTSTTVKPSVEVNTTTTTAVDLEDDEAPKKQNIVIVYVAGLVAIIIGGFIVYRIKRKINKRN